uniref:23S rRNA (Guanosine(2251)-2'-O)-methyltransferase RlmB n=1 Tax=Archaeoglobus fulgidus TaxID=2234 RepID=A0A7C3RCB5_ARCFL
MKITDLNSIKSALLEGKVVRIFHSGDKSPKIAEIIEIARKKGVPVYRKEGERLSAEISPIKYAEFDYIVKRAISRNTFILFLDNVVDQRNIGACIRTAEFFGAAGVVLPKRRGGSVQEGALKASAGAVFHIPIARVENFAAAIKKLKKLGFAAMAADLDGEDLEKVSVSLPAAVVIGGEDKGVSRPVKKQCDAVARINGVGKVNSLNLSVAAGIVLYCLSRQNY